MLIISIAFLYWYMRMTRRERAFATITEKVFVRVAYGWDAGVCRAIPWLCLFSASA